MDTRVRSQNLTRLLIAARLIINFGEGRKAKEEFVTARLRRDLTATSIVAATLYMATSTTSPSSTLGDHGLTELGCTRSLDAFLPQLYINWDSELPSLIITMSSVDVKANFNPLHLSLIVAIVAWGLLYRARKSRTASVADIAGPKSDSFLKGGNFGPGDAVV